MVAAIKLTDLQQLSHTSFNVKSFVGKIFTETDPQKTTKFLVAKIYHTIITKTI